MSDPSASRDGGLVARFAHYIEVAEEERCLLLELQTVKRDFRRRETILDRGDAMDDILVVETGWVYGHSAGRDGSEFLAELYLPGDFIGVSQIGFAQSTLTYIAATEVVVSPFSKRSLDRMLCEHPRLVALIFSLASLEHAATIDRMRAIGRMSARDNLATFLLQILARLRIAAGRIGEMSFDMPLSQEMIGNVVGLSMVSVNRAFRQLEGERHIRRDGRRIEILNLQRLGAAVDFVDRYRAVDTSWFPQSAHGR